tara:strand:+ start:107 stop:325 length:219 start_codon:yes stop_codon:yes gene_type:complete
MDKKKYLIFILIMFVFVACEEARYCAQCYENNTGYTPPAFCGESDEVDDYINELTSQGEDMGQVWDCSKIIE